MPDEGTFIGKNTVDMKYIFIHTQESAKPTTFMLAHLLTHLETSFQVLDN